MSLHSYRHQIVDNLNKLIKQNGKENSSMIAISIILVISIYRMPTRFLEKYTLILNISLKRDFIKDVLVWTRVTVPQLNKV